MIVGVGSERSSHWLNLRMPDAIAHVSRQANQRDFHAFKRSCAYDNGTFGTYLIPKLLQLEGQQRVLPAAARGLQRHSWRQVFAGSFDSISHPF